MHAVFLLDEYAPEHGGLYSLHAGFMSLLHDQFPGLKISCWCTKPVTSDISEEWSFLTKDSLLCYNNCDVTEEIYCKVEKNVTHIFVFASSTLKCALPGGIVGRIATTSAEKQIYLIIVNDCWNKNNDDYNFIEKRYQEVQKGIESIDNIIPMHFSLALTCYSDSHTKLESLSDKGGYSKIYYPYYKPIIELESTVPDPDLKLSIQVLSFVSLTSKDCEFIKKYGVIISKVNAYLRKSSPSGTRNILWQIYYRDSKDTDNNQNVLNELLKCSAQYMETKCIDLNSSGVNRTIKHLLKNANFALVTGDFYHEIYSGLELVLSGIPTFFEGKSDTDQILRQIDNEKAEFYALRNDEHAEEKLRNHLSRDEYLTNFKNVKEFASKYTQAHHVADSHKELFQHFYISKRRDDLAYVSAAQTIERQCDLEETSPKLLNSPSSLFTIDDETVLKTSPCEKYHPYVSQVELAFESNDGPASQNMMHSKISQRLDLSSSNVPGQLEVMQPSRNERNAAFIDSLRSQNSNSDFFDLVNQFRNTNLSPQTRMNVMPKYSQAFESRSSYDEADGPSSSYAQPCASNTPLRPVVISHKSKKAPKVSFRKEFQKITNKTKQSSKKNK